jgi:hypothetical protein
MGKKRENKAWVVVADGPVSPLPNIHLQHAWFELARARDWQTLALVPVDVELGTLKIAQGMAQMAAQEPQTRTLVVNASVRGCGTHVQPRGDVAVDEVFAAITMSAEQNGAAFDLIDFSRLDLALAERALAFAPKLVEHLAREYQGITTAIFAVDSVLHQTRAIPLVRAVDRVALCIALGLTSIPDARRAIEIIGRERIAGTILVDSIRASHYLGLAPSEAIHSE